MISQMTLVYTRHIVNFVISFFLAVSLYGIMLSAGALLLEQNIYYTEDDAGKNDTGERYIWQTENRT